MKLRAMRGVDVVSGRRVRDEYNQNILRRCKELSKDKRFLQLS